MDTIDASRIAPALRSVTVGNQQHKFENSGWADSHAVFAVNDLRSFGLSVVMDFNDDDALVDTLALLFERRSGVLLTECYSPEPMQVRSQSTLDVRESVLSVDLAYLC
jgi:hypothetical protein